MSDLKQWTGWAVINGNGVVSHAQTGRKKLMLNWWHNQISTAESVASDDHLKSSRIAYKLGIRNGWIRLIRVEQWNTSPLEDAAFKKGYNEAYEYNEVIAETMDNEFNAGVEAVIEGIRERVNKLGGDGGRKLNKVTYLTASNAITIAEGVKK